MSREVAVAFEAEGTSRVGIVHLPERPSKRGVLIIVGGWQYRAGSHRQFVLLARALAEAGVAAMRFDSRGMGDSEDEPGQPEPAEHLTPEIGAALDTFAAHAPEVTEFTLCGLCDGASAALMYAPGDPRVTGLVLLNPWASSPEGSARAMLQHYYLNRLRDPDLWRKTASGRLDIMASLRALGSTIMAARGVEKEGYATSCGPAVEAGTRIYHAMTKALDTFGGRILLVLSGRDLTARQYGDVVSRSGRWRSLLRTGRAKRVEMPEADHTFSRRVLRDSLADQMVEWLQSGPPPRARRLAARPEPVGRR